MKDLPHHRQKLNRQVIRSAHREELADGAFESTEASPPRKQTAAQVKKQAKARISKERNTRTPTLQTAEEKNKKMKKRNPVFFDQNHATQKTTRATRKKTPRLSKKSSKKR